jgi:hypothetical protein
VVPTLAGRIQTRLALLAVVGGVVTAIIVPVLPVPASVSLGDTYRNAFLILAAVAVLGVGWEFIYHFLMQWRWEKDWPTFFGFATFLNEGILVYVLARNGALPGIDTVPFWFFWIDFLAVWIVVWLIANGPMRVPFLHWRFFGGRLV